jgi:hypothetical protein
MKSICPEITIALELAEQTGNSVKEFSDGWSKVKEVFAMEKKLTSELKKDIQDKLPTLEYWTDPGSPQLEPDEGFVCRDCAVSISFPIKRNIFR